MTRTLRDSEISTIINALLAAANVYKDAASVSDTPCLREQFERQRREATVLADAFETAQAVAVCSC